MTSQMSYPHQDWKPVVLRSRAKQAKPAKTAELAGSTNVELKYKAGKNIQNKNTINAKSIEKNIDEDENLSVPTVSYNLQLQLKQARQQKGWTQKQLANDCQLPEYTIKGYENGTIIPNSLDIVKMSKSLGVTLKNKIKS